MGLTKAIITIFALLMITSVGSHAQTNRVKVQGGRRTIPTMHDTLLRDSMRLVALDTLMRKPTDSINLAKIDSLLKTIPDSLKKYTLDSIIKKMPDSLKLTSAQFLQPKYNADSLMRKQSTDSAALTHKINLPLRKFSFTRDTISAGAMFGLSLIPGVGQIYNRQYWKVPVFYAAIGAFATAGIITSNQYTNYRNEWQHAVNMNYPAEVTNPLKRKMQNAGSVRTVMYALTAVTYLYQVADATFNYRGYNNPVRKATLLAAVFPGAGFVYTKTYWRIPIYYGGFVALGTVVDYNNRYFQRYKTAYNALIDGDPTTIDEFRGRYSPEALKNARDAYRRDRDFGIICLSAAYLLSVIDTYVISTLKNWDVSRDLSRIRVTPTLFDSQYSTLNASAFPTGAGLSMKIQF